MFEQSVSISAKISFKDLRNFGHPETLKFREAETVLLLAFDVLLVPSSDFSESY